MSLELSKNELYKILDAVKAYEKDYYVNESVTKMFKEIQKKVKKEIKQIEFGRQ